MIPCAAGPPHSVQLTRRPRTNKNHCCWKLLNLGATCYEAIEYGDRGPSEYIVQNIAGSKSPICSFCLDLYFHSVHLSFRAKFMELKGRESSCLGLILSSSLT